MKVRLTREVQMSAVISAKAYFNSNFILNSVSNHSSKMLTITRPTIYMSQGKRKRTSEHNCSVPD